MEDTHDKPLGRVTRSKSRNQHARQNRPAPTPESFCDLALTSTRASMNLGKAGSKHRGHRTQGRQYFPFSFLPVDCQLLIFSFLSEVGKCTAARVCVNWAKLMRTPRLWRVANFMRLGNLQPDMSGVMVSVQEFDKWQEWVYNYAFHLTSRCASLHVLRTCFDLSNQKTKWTNFFLRFLEEIHCNELQELEFNWTLTHSKFYGFFESDTFVKLSPKMNEQFNSFLILIEKFTHCSPKLNKIKLPFDWSERSVLMLIRFDQLHTLELNRFWVSKAVSPKIMQFLTRSLPNLKVFKLQMAVPVVDFGITYSLDSKSLQHLDVTRSQGFVLSTLDLPSLKELRVRPARDTMQIPQTDLAIQRKWPCLYDLMRSGTPNLQLLNSHVLLPTWREATYRALRVVLKQACSCIHHTRLV